MNSNEEYTHRAEWPEHLCHDFSLLKEDIDKKESIIEQHYGFSIRGSSNNKNLGVLPYNFEPESEQDFLKRMSFNSGFSVEECAKSIKDYNETHPTINDIRKKPFGMKETKHEEHLPFGSPHLPFEKPAVKRAESVYRNIMSMPWVIRGKLVFYHPLFGEFM